MLFVIKLTGIAEHSLNGSATSKPSWKNNWAIQPHPRQNTAVTMLTRIIASLLLLNTAVDGFAAVVANNNNNSRRTPVASTPTTSTQSMGAAVGGTTVVLYMGLFDGVKDAFGAPALERTGIDAERETPIDRWMGWSVAKEDNSESAVQASTWCF